MKCGAVHKSGYATIVFTANYYRLLTFSYGCPTLVLRSAIEIIAKFPLVVVEKGMDINGPGFAEDKIERALAAIKATNPNVSGIFYYNSAMDWPFYRLHQTFKEHPQWWLRDWPSGKVHRIR